MELLWIFLLIFHGCAGLEKPRRECVVFNIPHILCAPDVSKVSIMPYLEYASTPQYRDLLSKHSCKSLYDLLSTGVPVKLECCEPKETAKPLEPPAIQTLPKNETDTYTPVPLSKRRTALDESESKCNSETEKSPQSNVTKSEDKEETGPGYTVVDDYSTYRTPEKEHPLTALVDKASDCPPSPRVPPLLPPQCKDDMSTINEEPVLQNAPTSRFVPEDSDRPVCANPRYVAQLTTLHSKQPHNARTYDQNYFLQGDQGIRFVPDYSPHRRQSSNRNCNVGHPHYVPINKNQDSPPPGTVPDNREVSPTQNSSRDYYKFCNRFSQPKQEPAQYFNQDQYRHCTYSNNNQRPQNVLVYPQYEAYHNHRHQSNDYNRNVYHEETCPFRDHRTHDASHKTHQHSSDSYLKDQPPRSPQDKDQKLDTTPNNGQQSNNEGSDKRKDKPPTYSKVDILSCDREVKPPSPSSQTSPNSPGSDSPSEPNSPMSQPRPFDIDFTDEDYTGSSIDKGVSENNGEGEAPSKGEDYQGEKSEDKTRTPESDGGGTSQSSKESG